MNEQEAREEGEYLRKELEAVQKVLRESLEKVTKVIESRNANMRKIQLVSEIVNSIPNSCSNNVNRAINHAILIKELME